MKKRAKKKLVISKETLINFKDGQLLVPHGGDDVSFFLCSFVCPTSSGAGGFCDHDCTNPTD